jgi:hypothetical protein
MILIAVQLKSILGDALEVGVWTPNPGGAVWAKALLLTYTQATGGVVGRLKLAISLGGAPADINGLVVIVEGTVALKVGAALHLEADSSGTGTFFIPFGGGLTKDGDGKVSALLAFDMPEIDPGHSLGNAGLALSVGKPAVGGNLGISNDGAVTWSAFARFGEASQPDKAGLRVGADFAKLLGDLATFVHIEGIEQRYSPELRVVKGNAPAFDLNQQGGA